LVKPYGYDFIDGKNALKAEILHEAPQYLQDMRQAEGISAGFRFVQDLLPKIGA
jgi:hypothetical protein